MTSSLDEAREYHRLAEANISHQGGAVSGAHLTHGTLVLRSSNIQNDALAFDDNVFVDADVPERIMVKPGDVLVCAFLQNGESVLFFVL
jgi:hypothetical protein